MSATTMSTTFPLKIKLHYSCEIEDFVETTHLRTLCVVLRSLVVQGVYVLMKGIGRRLPLELASTS